ncbi:MAG: glycosyl transferase, partial [Acidobacteria bacterium]
MPRPRVSVLLPVFNAVEHLAVCLKSLERQTLDDFEVVAVDDGSSDGS